MIRATKIDMFLGERGILGAWPILASSSESALHDSYKIEISLTFLGSTEQSEDSLNCYPHIYEI